MQVNVAWCEILRSHQINVVSRIHRILSFLTTYSPCSEPMRIIWVLDLVHPNGLLCDMVLNKISLIQSIWWECEQLVEEGWTGLFCLRHENEAWCADGVEELRSWIYAFLHCFIHSSRFMIELKWACWCTMKKKVSGQACAYVEHWGPKNWKYGGEFLCFSPSFPIQCGVSMSYLTNGMGPKEGMCRRFILQRGDFMEKGCQLRTLSQPHHHLI